LGRNIAITWGRKNRGKIWDGSRWKGKKSDERKEEGAFIWLPNYCKPHHVQ
jgi:hypothetical protein